MNNLNIIGYLARDPEIMYSKNEKQTCIARFTVGVDSYNEDSPVWIPCVAFGKTGETVEKYFAKGMKVAVTGRIDANDWKDKEGNRHYDLQCIVERFDFFQAKKEESSTKGKLNQQDASAFIPE